MTDYTTIPLSPEQLMRLGFEEGAANPDHWHDIDSDVMIYKLDDGLYQQYVYDERDEELIVGIALTTVADLMARYKSMTGYELKYWEAEGAQTAQ